MPVPVETPSWVTNLWYVLGGGGTFAGAGIAAYFIKRREAKAEVASGPGIVAVAGVLQDSKAISRLTDQLSDNGQSMRDLERTLRDRARSESELCRSIDRLADLADAMRRFMELRDAREKSEEARMLKIIDASRTGVKP